MDLKKQYQSLTLDALERTYASGNLSKEDALLCKQVIEEKKAAKQQKEDLGLDSDYGTSIMVAKLVSAVGWVICCVAVIIVFAAIGGAGRLGLLAIAPGVGVLIGGLLLVISGQGARAVMDNANSSRQMLQLQLQSKN